MQFYYLDEAGCTGVLPSSTSPVQPLFLMAGVIISQSCVGQITRDFVDLKARFFPGAMARIRLPLDRILVEIKGADLRADLRSGNHRRCRHAVAFLEHLLDLLARHNARVMGRIYIKGIGGPFDGRAVYTASMQAMCNDFQHLLHTRGDTGMIVADSRTKPQNAAVSHSIFTQKFQATGDDWDRILEMPTFGHSENHAGLQMADLVCSALLFPMAAYTYCSGRVASVHVNSAYTVLKTTFTRKLMPILYRYKGIAGKWRGGLTVSDGLAHRSSSLLFKP